jgi:hypothetical protein
LRRFPNRPRVATEVQLGLVEWLRRSWLIENISGCSVNPHQDLYN